MKRSLILAAAGVFLVAPRALADGPGEVTAVSVLPGAGRANVVIDVRGSVEVQDFTLTDPARLVIDLVGAQLSVPGTLYDGRVRAGIRNVRYTQFRPDVVRVVLELESLQDYQLEYAGDAVRIALGSDHSFQAWSSIAYDGSSLADGYDSPAVEERSLFAPREIQALQSQQPLLTITFDSAHIRDVANVFAEYSGKSIIIGRDIDMTVDAVIKNQPWDLAFAQILHAHGLAGTEDPPGIIRVASRAAMVLSRDSFELVETRIEHLEYARATSLATTLASVVSARGNVVADTGTNSLIITEVESRVAEIVDLVHQLDMRTPQVSIQAKLIFVDRTDIEELGVKYDLGTSDHFYNELVQRPDPSSAEPVDTDGDGVPDAIRATEFFEEDVNIVDLGGNALAGIANADAIIPNPALQLIFSTAIGSFNLTSFVDALQRVELADLQAEPLTTTADNTEAYILVGERTPIRTIDVGGQAGATEGAPRAVTEIVPTGLQLRVTPHVTNSRQVLMQVAVENSSIRAAPADVGFTFQTQEAASQILVEDGETAVIGGLTVTEVSVSKSGIPFLVDLPFIGGMFGYSQRREQRRDLLILVTPRVLDSTSGN
jgi:type IV pilus assembly protein PilQ